MRILEMLKKIYKEKITDKRRLSMLIGTVLFAMVCMGIICCLIAGSIQETMAQNGDTDMESASCEEASWILESEAADTGTTESLSEETESLLQEETQESETESEPDYDLTDVIEVPDVDYPYYIKVNRQANCVTVYTMDENGEYTVPIKAMICSVGLNDETPLGVFTTSDKYEWRYLYGDVYGQYAYRIEGSIMFHSVPYYTMNKDDLETEEYNKLGEAASLGCIRLSCADAKWLVDNCPSGTTVEIYDAEDPGPLGRPTAITIDPDSPYAGWDPTDPDPDNPWNQTEDAATETEASESESEESEETVPEEPAEETEATEAETTDAVTEESDTQTAYIKAAAKSETVILVAGEEERLDELLEGNLTVENCTDYQCWFTCGDLTEAIQYRWFGSYTVYAYVRDTDTGYMQTVCMQVKYTPY